MKKNRLALIALFLPVLFGCYRADISTGLAPSGEVIEDEWVLGFVGGLAMVDDVDAGACTNGIARVMTRQSFLNVLVNVLTGGIVSPMEVRVECAAGASAAAKASTARAAFHVRAGSEPLGEALERAAVRSAETGDAVFVRITE